MAGSRYERLLAAETLVVMGAQTVDALSGSGGQGFALPDPSRYFAALIVYISLAGVAMFGDKVGKVAAGLGGVAALAMLLAPTKRTGKPLAMSLVDFSTQITTGGFQGGAGEAAAAAAGPQPAGDVAASGAQSSTQAGPGFRYPNQPAGINNPALPSNPNFSGPPGP